MPGYSALVRGGVMTFVKRRYHPIVGANPPRGRPLLCVNCGCPLGLVGTRPASRVYIHGASPDDAPMYIHDGGCPHPFFTDYHRRQWGLPALYTHLFQRPRWWQRLLIWLKSLWRFRS